MSHERPEDQWKREKQYQSPAPGQSGPPSNSPNDEARWMQEKQSRVAQRPDQPQNPQEKQWMREKQGQGQGSGQYANNGQDQWMAEKRGQQPPPGQPPRSNGQEQQWMAEKRGGAPGPNQYPPPGQGQQPGQGQPPGQSQQWMAEKRGGAAPGQDQQWMAEKQGNFGGPNQYQPPGQGQQWTREKQGLPPLPTPPGPPSPQEEKEWHQAKNFKGSSGNRKLYLLLGGIGAVVVVAIIVVVVLLLLPKNTPGPIPPAVTAGASTTTAATTTSTTTASPTTVAVVTTAAVTTPAATTAAPVTTQAKTTGAAGDSAKLLSLAQEAANNNRWQDVVNSLELLSPSDPNFAKAKPLLVKAYFQLGELAVADKSNSQESANLALTNFRKANALDPSFEGLAKELQRADAYATGLLQFQSEQYNQAVDTIKPLYNEAQLQTDGVHYRNTATILYNSYLKLGDKTFKADNIDALTQARNFYSQALTIDVPNKDDANGKLAQVIAALKLLGVTQTPKK